MKTLVIIAGVLVVTTAVYGFDATRLRKFHDDFVKCSEEMNLSPDELSVESMKCATIRDGEVLNTNREYIKEKALQRIGDLISDAGKLEEALAIYNKCYDDVLETEITGEEQTTQILRCIMPIIPLIDQPQ